MNNLLGCNGEVCLIKGYYQPEDAQQIFTLLLQTLDWKEEQILIYGRWAKVPRLMCWYGDEEARYRYSGVNHQPLQWKESLLSIKKKIEQQYECSFNSVMANLYRNGTDSMGCHADDETELGENPTIASLSFGEERILKFRHRYNKQVVDVILNHGDLLLMSGETQHFWKHELPKTKKHKTERINLTFRKIVKID